MKVKDSRDKREKVGKLTIGHPNQETGLNIKLVTKMGRSLSLSKRKTT